MLDMAVREVTLTQGMVALVDECDFALVSRFSWRPYRGHRTWYARTEIKRGRFVRMHRMILNAPDGVLVDRRNCNGLDNTRHNIRLCTTSQNCCNQRPFIRPKSSRFKGVHWHKGGAKWAAEIVRHNKKYHIGLFTDEVEAAIAYDSAALIHHGDFARLNFPVEVAAP